MHIPDRAQAHTGAIIRALREAYGWRAARFADACDVSPSFLSNIEAGRRGTNPELLRRMATVLGVPLAALTSDFDVEEIA